MANEKCKLVQIALAKLCADVPNNYSRSCDKIREMVQALPMDVR